MTVVGIIATIVVKKGWVKADLVEKLKLDVAGVVNAVYQEYVKGKKEASADGKLT